MAKIVRLETFSFKNTKENIGTKIYPNDSKTAISFNCTPLLIAHIFISNTKEKTP